MSVVEGERNVPDTPQNNGGNQKMKIQRREMPIIAQKKLENLKAENEDQKATIMYLSMMSGIDIPAEQDASMPQSTTGGEKDE